VFKNPEELTHNYGSEKEDGQIYHPGNEPPEGDRQGWERDILS